MGSLNRYVYQSAHVEIMRRRNEWFLRMREAYVVLWWVPRGHRPDAVEAIAKLELLQGYRDREGLEWDAHKLQLVDLQYSDVRPDKGLYNRLVARGRMQRIVSDSEVDAAVTEPPHDTRAYFRGRCLSKFADDVAAASWDSVIFDVGRESLVRVPTLEPLRGTKAHVGELLERCPTAASLIEALVGPR